MAQVAASAAATVSDTLHDVHFGSSFLSASQAGAGANQQDALFSLKYASKPASLDAGASGKLWADPSSSSAVYAAFPSTGSSATAGGKAVEHRFSGKVESAKEVDCVLIWDEELQSFSLERIDGNVRLAVDREGHGGPTPALRTSLPSPRPPAASALMAPGPSKLRASSRGPDAASSDSQDSEDSEIRVPSVPPAHLRKLASERARQSLARKSDTGLSGAASAGENGLDEDGARGRPGDAAPKKQEPEVEDFGDISFGGGSISRPPVPPATAVEPKAPLAAAPASMSTPLSLPSSRSSTPAGRAPPTQPKPRPAPPPAPVVPPPAPVLSLPKSSPPRPTPPPPQPAPPPGPIAALAPPPRSSPAQKAPMTSKRPPSRKAPSKASKIPASSAATADGSSSPKKGRRRSSVAQKSMPLSKATISSSEGSSDGDSDDSDDSGSGSGSGSDEEDSGIPEGYLARPGSILSASAGGSAIARPAARKAPMKAPPVATAASDSGSGSGSGSDSDDESDDMEILASSINSALTGPAVGPGRVQGQLGKGKGGAKRGAGAAASKIPASISGRAAYASKVPASMRSSIASKIPASSSGGARAQKGPARSGGYADPDAARRAADIPDSESEED